MEDQQKYDWKRRRIDPDEIRIDFRDRDLILTNHDGLPQVINNMLISAQYQMDNLKHIVKKIRILCVAGADDNVSTKPMQELLEQKVELCESILQCIKENKLYAERK